MFELFSDPHIWVGLLTLVLLEIVLGIDNLVFIAILAEKLPKHQRDKARLTGLGMALFMRLGLLASISWMVSLTQPLFTVIGHEFSGRDLILLGGGFFLLFKATREIHERLEGHGDGHKSSAARASFWLVVSQIIVLDAVFSLDSVITAVGMSDHLPVMFAAVIIAMVLMIFASKPLTTFVNAHPTVIMLCLGFLLLVGFSLVADGLGYHVPKGYLYAAIGFSILIEAFNQTTMINNRKRALVGGDLRRKTADAVLRILSGKPGSTTVAAEDISALMYESTKKGSIFSPEEREMIHGVLQMTERQIRTIMTPRGDMFWIDLNDPPERVFEDIRSSSHAVLLACRGSLDEVVGVLRKADLVAIMEPGKVPDITAILRKPLIVHEGISILKALELFKKDPVHMAVIVDEYGSVEGIITMTDIMEAIAGDIPDHEDDMSAEIAPQSDGSILFDGMVSIYDAQKKLGLEELPEGDFTTLAGFILYSLGHVPKQGESVTHGAWTFTVKKMEKNRVVLIHAKPKKETSEAA